ncbi:MAG: hypothetical protein FWH27_03545 [Planctomycetaceae bacterium]|nr:hypothetical protein [Planctomycetaceae bacterium]
MRFPVITLVIVFLAMTHVSCVRRSETTSETSNSAEKTAELPVARPSDAELRQLYQKQMANHQSDAAARTALLIRNESERHRVLIEICNEQCRVAHKSVAPDKMLRKAVRTAQLIREGKDRNTAITRIANVLCDYRETYAADMAFEIAAVAGSDHADGIRSHVIIRTLDDFGDHSLGAEQLKSRIAWAEKKLEQMQSPVEKGLVLTHIAKRSSLRIDTATAAEYTDKATEMLKLQPGYPLKKVEALLDLALSVLFIHFPESMDNQKAAYYIRDGYRPNYYYWRWGNRDEEKKPNVEQLKKNFLIAKETLAQLDDTRPLVDQLVFSRMYYCSQLLKVIGDPEFAKDNVFDMMERHHARDRIENPNNIYRQVWIPFADVLAELGEKDAARSIYLLYEPEEDRTAVATKSYGSRSPFPFSKEEADRFAPFLFPILSGSQTDLIMDETGAILGLANNSFYDDAIRFTKKTSTSPVFFCYLLCSIADECIKHGDTEHLLEIRDLMKGPWHLMGLVTLDHLVRQAKENELPGFREFDFGVTVEYLIEIAQNPQLSGPGYVVEPAPALALAQALYYAAGLVLQEKQDKELAKDLVCQGIEYVRATKPDPIRRDNRYFIKELVMLEGIRMLLSVDSDDERGKPLTRAVFQLLQDNLKKHLNQNYLPDEEAIARGGNTGYISTVPASMIVIRELADAANLAGDRDTLIDLMDFCPKQDFYQYPRDLWDRCKKLIIEGVPQH